MNFNKRLMAFFICMLHIISATATPDIDSLMKTYATEHGVITEYTEHLVLEYNKEGQLVANAKTTKDILIINEKYNQFFNTGSVHHSYFAALTAIDAATLIPTGKSFKKVKTITQKTKRSPDESIFYDDAQETEVTFSNVGRGAITHLSYTTHFRDLRLLPRFYFQSYLPIASVTVKVTFPKDVSIESILKGGFDANLIKKSEEENRKTKTITWQAYNLPKAKTYADGPPIASYIPHVIIYVKNYNNILTGEQTNLFGSIAGLYNSCYNFVKDLKPEPAASVKQMAVAIVQHAQNDREKAAQIFRWVQQNIKYVAFEDSLGGFVPREPEVVLHRRFGDCKDMSALLRALCRSVGLEAHYVWIGSRKIPYRYEDTPLPFVFNHMIAVVKLDGKWVFMDGTDPQIPFGKIPYALQDKEGLIGINATDYEVVNMPIATPEQNGLIDSSYVKIDKNTLVGTASVNIVGYPAWDMGILLKYQVEREKKKLFDALIQRGNNKFNQKAFNYNDSDSIEKSLSVQASFDIKDYVQLVGDEYYVNLNLHRSYAGTKIDAKERSLPIEVDYAQFLKQVVVLEIPEGYNASYVPQNVQKAVPGLGRATFNYYVEDNKIILDKHIEMTPLQIKSDQFANYNQLIETLQASYKESIVLSPAK
jgi:transglutaminase-like putative cysteine protease